MIKYVTGNFFDYPADIRINTVNCVGVMGAGVALQFKERYPNMFREYSNECRNGRVKIGCPHVWLDNDFFKREDLIIINFPTKDNWRNPSEYEFIEKGLFWLREFLKRYTGKTITIPALGCGHGGLDWGNVKRLIEDYLSDIDLEMLVFEPTSSRASQLTEEDKSNLQEYGITKIDSSNFSFHESWSNEINEFWVQGDPNILFEPKLAIVMDSKTTEREINATIACIESLPNNVVFFLGFTSKVEIDLVKFLLSRNARIIIMIPYGILKLKLRKDIESLWNPRLITVISVGAPNQQWSISESIKALKFRIGLSEVSLFTQSDPSHFISKYVNQESNRSKLFYINYGKTIENFLIYGIGRNRENRKPNIFPIIEELGLR